MRQSKRLSVAESIANTVIGLFVSYMIQLLVFPMLGIIISHSTNVKITLMFFVASFIRGYMIRRFFNKLREVKG